MVNRLDKRLTIDDVITANKVNGYHFFDKSTMRFFNSRIMTKLNEGYLINNKYFITSEKFDDNSPRLYTIREYIGDGDIDTVGEFQQFRTVKEALEYAKGLSD